jgi:hypothetical protein
MTEPDPKTTLREFREAAIEVLCPSSRQTVQEYCTQAVLVWLQSDKHEGDSAFYPLVWTKHVKSDDSDLPMKLTIELEEPYAKELELRAYRSGQTVKECVEESMRTVVVADMSFDEKTALHKELAERN